MENKYNFQKTGNIKNDLGENYFIIKQGKVLLSFLAVFLGGVGFHLLYKILRGETFVFLSSGQYSEPISSLYIIFIGVICIIVACYFVIRASKSQKILIYEYGVLVGKETIFYKDLKFIEIKRGSMVNVQFYKTDDTMHSVCFALLTYKKEEPLLMVNQFLSQ